MPYSEKERQRALKMFSKGVPYNEIRDKVGCCTATVRRWARNRDIERQGANCKYGPHERQKALQMYKNGATHDTICSEIGCGTATFQRWLKSSDLKLRSDGLGIPDGKGEEVIEKYRDGDSLQKLGRLYNCTAETIRKHLLDNDIETRAPGSGDSAVSDKERERMVELYESGLSQGEIGDKTGYDQTTVGNHLRREGVSGDPGRGAPTGEDHGNWKGGKIQQSGYVAVKVDPEHRFYDEMAHKSGYILEHRLKIAEAIGRPLRQTETVHHKNGKKKDNRLENLQLRQGRHGKGECAYCKDCGSHNIGFE